MKNKIKNAFNKIALFWDAQKHNFYFGMVLCMLFIVGISYCMPEILGLLLAPVFSAIVYFLIWMFNCRKKYDKKTFLENNLTAFAGSLWTLLFALI